MTNKEAIQIIKARFYPSHVGLITDETQENVKALRMAIEALQSEPTHGRLIDVDELIKKYGTCEDIDCDTCPIWECGCDGLLQILREAPIIKNANEGGVE